MVTFSKFANVSKSVRTVHVTSAAIAILTAALILYNRRRQAKSKHKSVSCSALKPQYDGVDDIRYMIREQKQSQPKAFVNRDFFRQLKALLHILFPKFFSAEVGLLAMVASGLVVRSMFDLWLITIATQVERVIVSQNDKIFAPLLVKMLCLAPIVSIVNNILKWSTNILKIRLRENLTLSLYDDYLRSFTYYRLNNIDNRISNPDQLLTTDVVKFSDSFVDMYSNMAKPILDIGLYMYRLTSDLGATTPFIMLMYLAVAGVTLTWIRKPLGRLTVTEQKLEGEFRHINSRLITHAEEVAFYQGNERERLILMASFHRLISHLRKFLRFKTVTGILDSTIAKYMASIIGFYAVSLPFMSKTNRFAKMNRTARFQNYYTFGRMLVKLAEAIGRLIMAGRELTRLAGFTARVTQLRTILYEINEGRYQRTMVTAQGAHQSQQQPQQPPSIKGQIILRDNLIRFENVPLMTPNGDMLIESLNFEVTSGKNVLICGPNGCGKSSLFRVLGELWPVFDGVLTKPSCGKLFYIPQRPYMTLGTLRDQLIYPDSVRDAIEKCTVRDSELREFLKLVQLEYLLERENGFDAIEDWLDVLSGGEKQRIAMARLFYHKPQFAILDECTSAVSVDVEGSMYQYCREAGITLFTVSHRKSLWKHHEYFLRMDGHGHYEFGKIDAETEQFGS